MAIQLPHLSEEEILRERNKISKELQFIPTIQGIDNKIWFVVNEKEFVQITHRIFADDYNYLNKVLAQCIDDERRTAPDVLAAFDFNGVDYPKTKELPESWFDPFGWRYALTRKFEEYVLKNDFVFDAHGAIVKIKSQASAEINIDKIKQIKYDIEIIEGGGCF